MDYDTQLINLALDAGEIMLASGAETFRVQDTMQRILSVSGKEKIEALAMCTLLMVTLPREEKGPLSMARAVKNRDLNFEKICAVNDMSRAFVSGKISVTEALDRASSAMLSAVPALRLWSAALCRIFWYPSSLPFSWAVRWSIWNARRFPSLSPL